MDMPTVIRIVYAPAEGDGVTKYEKSLYRSQILERRGVQFEDVEVSWSRGARTFEQSLQEKSKYVTGADSEVLFVFSGHGNRGDTSISPTESGKVNLEANQMVRYVREDLGSLELGEVKPIVRIDLTSCESAASRLIGKRRTASLLEKVIDNINQKKNWEFFKDFKMRVRGFQGELSEDVDTALFRELKSSQTGRISLEKRTSRTEKKNWEIDNGDDQILVENSPRGYSADVKAASRTYSYEPDAKLVNAREGQSDSRTVEEEEQRSTLTSARNANSGNSRASRKAGSSRKRLRDASNEDSLGASNSSRTNVTEASISEQTAQADVDPMAASSIGNTVTGREASLVPESAATTESAAAQTVTDASVSEASIGAEILELAPFAA